MLLFVLRCAFWISLVALALPWFTVDKSQNADHLAVKRSSAVPTHVAARPLPVPQYFDDSTASLPSMSCGSQQSECDKDDAKVDLIALQLENPAPAPRKTAASRPARETASTRVAPTRHAARRNDSIADLLAR